MLVVVDLVRLRGEVFAVTRQRCSPGTGGWSRHDARSVPHPSIRTLRAACVVRAPSGFAGDSRQPARAQSERDLRASHWCPGPELLGRSLIVNEHHLRRMLAEYLRPYNSARPHRALGSPALP